MKIKNLLFISLFIPILGLSQVGIDVDNKSSEMQPTEDFHVNGTVRINDLPVNGSENSIYTDVNGNKSSTKNQTFTASKAVVADANGVFGTMNGLPETIGPNANPIRSVFISDDIDSQTPNNSIVTLDKLSVKFNGTTAGGTNENISIRLNGVTDKVIVNQWRTLQDGKKGGQVALDNVGSTWVEVGDKSDSRNILLDTADNQFGQYNISLIKSKEVYRVSVSLNTTITAPTSNDISSVPRVTIFIEKLGI